MALYKRVLFLIYFLVSLSVYSQVSVRGYYRKDGTYVRPHERTYPNSTVTDNYSYPGNYNPNLEYNPPVRSTSSSSYSNSYPSTSSSSYSNSYPSTSSSSYSKSYPSTSSSSYSNSYPSTSSSSYSNSYPSTSSSSYSKSYPSTSSSSYSNSYPRTSSSSYSNSYPSTSSSTYSNVGSISNNVEAYLLSIDIPSRIRYINSDYANVRSYPMVNDYNAIGVLDYNSIVILVEDLGKWSKVVVRDENSFRYAYIASNLLSGREAKTYSNTNVGNCDSYTVIVDQSYFHNSPDLSTKRKAYLLRGTNVCKLNERNGFIYVEFLNSRNQSSKGWLIKSELY